MLGNNRGYLVPVGGSLDGLEQGLCLGVLPSQITKPLFCPIADVFSDARILAVKKLLNLCGYVLPWHWIVMAVVTGPH